MLQKKKKLNLITRSGSWFNRAYACIRKELGGGVYSSVISGPGRCLKLLNRIILEATTGSVYKNNRENTLRGFLFS